MKRVLLFVTLFGSVGCSTPQVEKKGFEMPPALRETFRGGELKGLRTATEQDLGIPNQYDLVQHTCVSTPMYDIYGRLYKTDVRCW